MSGPTQAMCAVAMIQAHGKGPDGVECSECKHLKALPRIDRPQGSLFECMAWDCGMRSRFHRSSWPACGMFVRSMTGRAVPKPSQLVEIECPGCGAQRSFNRNYVEAHPGFDPRCGLCSKQAKDASPAPIFNGCRPVQAGEGKRCLQSYDCPNYEACLDYAAAFIWPGFRGSKDPKPERPTIPVKAKRPYHRRVVSA